jgi:membrane protease YdiL (CAAX protease family)
VETSVSEVRSDGAWSGRLLCWVESLILGLGMPAGIWVVSRSISLYIPAAIRGSREQRFLFWILGGVIVEWSFVLALWFVLRTRKSSFRDLGVWRMGTWTAWTLALLTAFLSIASNLRFLPRMHVPVYYAFMPHGFHLVAALLMGTTAGFCEEVLFRGFLMSEFFKAGYGKGVQVFIPGLAFGLSHCSSSRMHWHDVGRCLPTGATQPGSSVRRSFPERCDSASLDHVFYDHQPLGIAEL